MHMAALMPVIRHLLQLLAGWMLAQGYLTDGMTESFVGLGLAAFSLAWWYFSGKKPDEYDPSDQRGV